ncbi:MAG: hypothetical protein WD529_06830 [Balneolaceae bacterium]
MILVQVFLLALPVSLQSQSNDPEPPQGLSELQAYALFLENYRNEEYEMALMFGEWMLDAKPKTIEGHNSFNLDIQFNRLITVYSELGTAKTDPAERSEFLEKAEGVFDIVFETFDDEEMDRFEWTQRKGRFYQDHSSDFENGLESAYEQYEAAFEMDPARLTEMGDGYFSRILLMNYVARDERENALAMIDRLEQLELDLPLSLADAIDDARDQIFDTPEERAAYLESLIDGATEDELLTLLYELSDLYDRLGEIEKATNMKERLYELDPTFENTYRLAEMSLSNAEYSAAIELLTEALELAGSDTRRKEIAIEISDTYRNIDNLPEAREYARRAISIDEEWGQPYLTLATIYASAVSNCISGRTIERDDRAVYWLALDNLDRAVAVDPSLRNNVNNRASQYETVMPTTADKHFREWTAGESFRIDESVGSCYEWIDEETTIR